MLYVNNEPIDSALIEAEMNQMRPSYQRIFEHQPKDEQEKQLTEWACENIIEAVLFRQQAKKAFPQIPPDDIERALGQLLKREGENGTLRQRLDSGAEEVRKVRDEIADQLRLEKLHARITADCPEPSEKEIRRYYQQHLTDRFTIPEMVHAAHIVKHPNADESKEQQYQQMQHVKEQLDEGVPFEELAKDHSHCPENGGDLGFFARGKMVPAFEAVVFHLEPGTYSDVFETEFGYHIAKVFEKRPAVPCPLEQVHEVIVRDLTKEKQEKAIERFLDAHKEKASIKER